MLEIRDIRKTYVTKRGVITKALDGVSAVFPNRGMVFILGKSGSGKSTLLHICSGLDTADGGEIIINGHSCSAHEKFDFDSYRNTLVGIVFQEYNLLQEYTVQENIALALELQNKKADKDKIRNILRDMEMEELADRKPNTLSGGQKQRVAIARALVKDPEIIIADEPTGALDYGSGKQVLGTLKKLSHDKLVLVVSHDREFAEKYADRIIELRDGKIVSDTAEHQESEEVCETNGKPSSAAGEMRLTRSHLRLRHALKMGAAGLVSKPVKMVFTVLLSMFALLLFGVFSTLIFYDSRQTTVNAFAASGYDHINVLKKYYTTKEQYRADGTLYETYAEERNDACFSWDEFRTWESAHKGAVAAIEYREQIANYKTKETFADFYGDDLRNAVLDTPSLALLAGEHVRADDQILISDFLFACFKAGTLFAVDEQGQTSGGEQMRIDEYGDVLGKKLILQQRSAPYTITGIFKGATVPDAYASLRKAADEDRVYTNEVIVDDWYSERHEGLYMSIAVSENFFSKLGKENRNYNPQTDWYFPANSSVVLSHVKASGSMQNVSHVGNIAKYENGAGNRCFDLYDFRGNKVTELSARDIALSPYGYFEYLDKAIASMTLTDELCKEYYGEQNGQTSDIPIKTHLQDLKYIRSIGQALPHMEKVRDFIDRMQQSGLDISQSRAVVENDSGWQTDVTVVGAFYGFANISMGECAYVGDGLYSAMQTEIRYKTNYQKITTRYRQAIDAYIDTIFLPYDGSKNAAAEILQVADVRAVDDSYITLSNTLWQAMITTEELMRDIYFISLVAGAAFAVFSVLLMFHFISASIAARKKEIGILRAMGARKSDVFKIFLTEALIVALICIVFALAACWGLCHAINVLLISDAAVFSIRLLTVGPMSVVFVALLSLVSALTATVLPVGLYARKQPVESIRAK